MATGPEKEGCGKAAARVGFRETQSVVVGSRDGKKKGTVARIG